MAEGPKPPPDDKDGKKQPPRPRPRRSALDMRVLSSAIVADVESGPVKVPEPAPEPGPDVIPVPAPALAGTAPADPADDDDVLLAAPAGPRSAWTLGAIALGLAMILGIAMPRAAKRVDPRAAAAVAKTEPKENDRRSEATTAPVSHAGGSTTQSKDDPEIEMKAEPATATATATATDHASGEAKDDSKDDRAKDDSKDDSAKNDSKDDSAPKSGSKLDPKRAAEAELAYRDGEQRAAMGDTDGALTSLKRAADLNPGYAPTYRALGDVYAKRGDTGKARSSYQRYLKLAPNAGDAGKVRDRLEAL